MPSKYQVITEMEAEHLRTLTVDTDHYMDFLTTAANNFKYSFQEQLLIFAQKPDATACAEVSWWNKHGRWVNRNTRGIALLVDTDAPYKLRHVFDVSDTNSRAGKKVSIWKMEQRFIEPVRNVLAERYEVDAQESLEDCLLNVAVTFVNDNYQDYLAELMEAKAGSLLEKLDEDNTRLQMLTALSYSVGYMLHIRCGLPGRAYFGNSLDKVCNFNTPEVISILGAAVSDMSEVLLREIAVLVQDLQREERNQNRTFEVPADSRYDVNRTATTEGSAEYGSDLPQGGRVLPAGSDRAGGTEGWEVWNAAAEIPSGEPERHVHSDAVDRQAESASGGDRLSGERDDGNADRADGKAGGREREPESGEPDEVGRADEQHPGSSGGNRAEGTGVPVTRDIGAATMRAVGSTGLEVFHDEWYKDSKAPYYHSDEEKNELLRTSDALKGHRTEIASFFADHEDKNERADFIKTFFDNTFTEMILSNGQRAGYRAFDTVFMMWRGSANDPDQRVIMKWSTVADHITGMIVLHEWLSPDEAVLPSVNEQLSLIGEAESKKDSAFVMPQEAIDYVLSSGSGFEDGKRRIYQQFLKQEGTEANVQFLRREYGIGGHSDAIPGTDYWLEYDAKGLHLSKLHDNGSKAVNLSWKVVEKRIGELIALGRYLGKAEIERISAEQSSPKADQSTAAPANEEGPVQRHYSLGDKVYLGVKEYEILAIDDHMVRLYDSEYPLFNEELSRSDFDRRIAENPLNDQPKENSGEQAAGVKPQAIGRLDYLDSNGHVGEQVEYDDEIQLVEQVKEDVDTGAPFTITLYRDQNGTTIPQDFLTDLGTSPKGFAVVDYAEGHREYLLNENIRMINLYALECFEEKADFSDLTAVPLAYSTSGDGEHSIQVDADLEHCRMLYAVDNEAVAQIQYADLGDMNEFLVNMTFDELVAFAEHEYAAQHKEPEQTQEPQLTPPAVRKKDKTAPLTLLPEIPDTERSEYHISDDLLGVGTPSERYARNIRAITVLKKVEAEHRLATPEEQSVLAQYVGWGGLADCFDERNSHYAELKELLSDEEYEAARESTLTAFYTPPVVIRSMYQVFERLGFQRGNILEPSCGVGNFIGMRPDNLADSKIYGVELDSISGRIAQQLYQKSSIAVRGFEKTDLPDSFFDAAIGNIPFGSFKIVDKRYDKYNFLIHDYFFARTIDKVRPGGIIAFITSKGTMDKENPSVRKYLAQRAELLGAIRLPNNTFKDAAGTEVTADILILQKRDRMVDQLPAWVNLGIDDNGLAINQYFVDNPSMVLGTMQEVSGPYGPETACLPIDGSSLEELLTDAIQNINGSVMEYEVDDPESEEEDRSIPADPSVRNFSFTVVDGEVYYRENSIMHSVDLSVTGVNRVKGLIAIRECVRKLIEYQTEDYPDTMIQQEQTNLNALYDAFEKKYKRINTRANKSVFGDDSSFCLLSSLEVLDDEGNFVCKADMFSKRTIRQHTEIISVDTASEALAVSMGEKAKVDMPYMMQLTGKMEEEIFADLSGVIFRNPLYEENGSQAKYLTADEYLSGNVREKLAEARRSAESDPVFAVNVTALEEVQPTDLTASEISVRLGATWLPEDVVQKFMYELLDTPYYAQWKVKVHYSRYTGGWNVEGKSYDRSNINATSTYGTDRVNAYKIIEETLNLRDVRVFDYIEDENGKRVPVLNKKETAIAQGKQELIKQAFQDWIWKDQPRRERLCRLYNEQFNALRPREYDGSHLNFVGMNPEIQLRQHQLNAVAHILYGGNTLLAHVVGAGKTFEIVAAAQESKRLGLCRKSLIVVPNHLTEQWAAEYLQLYPSANILVATKKDFETKNRKRFCGRIATGDFDAIVIGHSQFEKIPMSVERQRYILEQQYHEIIDGIRELKEQNGDRFSVKQLERSKKAVQAKLDKLNDQSRKDDLVTFEELGVDRLFVDEAHYYKNLAAFSKMRNVGGISQTEAMKSSDLYMKIRYLDEITGGRGTVFATGTPISNSMVELYTMQKYLQYGTLKEKNLLHFDAWASTFGETVTAIELAPEGTGYRAKTRFARFYNLPELMSLFKQTADIQTADMLKLPVPIANYHNVVLKPSAYQVEMVKDLSERAERVRNRMVDSSVDNMLKITNDGRKLALDQRLMNPILPDDENSKVSACAKNVYEIWQKTAEQKSTQMVFCDLSTPHNDGKFNVYDSLRDKLLGMGIPEDQIAYIHNAASEAQKKELFGKVRNGEIRVLIGSTQKMGAGTNVQKKLIALHHVDCPWRPSDLQQREGRIIRQGNENPEVEIYTYVTENTFDSYLYQMVEGKQKFIGQVMTSKAPARSAEDIDETALSYAEVKALCTGNPYIKEKMDLDIAVQRLKMLKASHLSQRYALEDKIAKAFPDQIAALEQKISGYKSDIELREAQTMPNEDGFSSMEVEGTAYIEKKAAGSALLAAAHNMTSPDAIPIGMYRGFAMVLSFDTFAKEYRLNLKGQLSHPISFGTDLFGNIQRIDNMLAGLESDLRQCEAQLDNARVQLSNAKAAVDKPFPQEDELKTKLARLDELNILLNLDKRENEIVDGEPDEGEPKEKKREMER